MSGITDEIVEKAAPLLLETVMPRYAERKGWAGTKEHTRDIWRGITRRGLEAAAGDIRKQVAEELAAIAEEEADDLDLPVMSDYLEQRDWFKDRLHDLAAKAREIGGQS